MATLSGCTIVRNAVKLNYPLEASILTYLPVCDEVIVAYDPASEDETEALVRNIAKRYPKIRPIPSPWDLDNREDCSEITIQSNIAIEACTSEWVLYVQADEAIHEDNHNAIGNAIRRSDLSGAFFERRSFLYTLDREIPEYFARNLLRLFRNGEGYAIGDATTCQLVQGVSGRLLDAGWRMFDYSRIGDQEEVLLRCGYRSRFRRDFERNIDDIQKRELTQDVRHFDVGAHPAAIREWYENKPVLARQCTTPSPPVTLAVLMGNERENIVPFLWQFRGWPGEIIVIDDMTSDGSAEIMQRTAQMLGVSQARMKFVRNPLSGNFSAARNLAHAKAGADWILHADLDEQWDAELVRGLPELIQQLERDGKDICGFPRANFIDGVLVNDIPDSEWTKDGLRRITQRQQWPPRNRDIQYRLMRKTQEWQGAIYELPVGVRTSPERVVALREYWILHNKSLDRQRRQDAFYRTMGQTHGMPPEESAANEQREPNLRETVLSEAVQRIQLERITIVETGTLRDSSPEARRTDGWSTYYLAQLLEERSVAGSQLFSIDLNPTYIEISRRIVPSRLHRWVTWICADSRDALASIDVDVIDLLYLDSSDDPAVILEEFEAALPRLGRHSLVVVDDTCPYWAGPEGKGTLLIPEAKRRGWHVEHRQRGQSRMTILTRS